MNETGLEKHTGKYLWFRRRLLERCPWVPDSLGLPKSKARGPARRGLGGCEAGAGRNAVRRWETTGHGAEPAWAGELRGQRARGGH